MTPKPRHPIRTLAAAALLTAPLLHPTPTPAAVATWTAPASGNFGTNTNWSTGATPTSADTALFARGPAATYNVTFVGPLVGSSTGSPDYFSDSVVIGNNAVSFINSSPTRLPGTYTLSNPTLSQSGRALTVASAPTDTAASLTVAIRSLTATAATIADAAGSQGTLTVTSGSQFNITAGGAGIPPLIVGASGSGTLNVTGGADVHFTSTTGVAAVAYTQGSSGTLNVTGAGSTFNVPSSGFLVVGQNGAGALNVSAGGVVNGDVSVGAAGAGGAVTISGPGSTLNGGLTVATFAPGTVHVTNGATLDTGSTRLGTTTSTASQGTLTVTGPGTTWNHTGELSVGYNGTGTVNITAAAQVNSSANSPVYVGFAQGSTGTVNLSGAGTAWNHLGPLYVARQGRGTVNVSAGAIVNASTTHIAEMLNSDGALTLDGAAGQVTWSTAGTLTVGRGGRGTLTVTHGAHATAFTAVAGQFTNSTGTIRLDGPGSTLAVTDQLQLAIAGNATLDVLAGAKLTAGSLYAGVDPFAIAQITVDGPASALAVAGNTILSQTGAATLTLRNAASATLNGPLFLSTSGTASTINLTSNATLTVHGHVSDGSTGHSTLTLDGGTLDPTSHNLGGSSPINTLNFRSGTLRNIAQINNGATGLTKTSPGTLTLEGANTYTGPTTVQQGTLLLKSSLTTSSHLEVAPSALVQLPQSPTTPRNVLLKTPTLSLQGPSTLDLTDNKLALTATTPDLLRAYLFNNYLFSSLSSTTHSLGYLLTNSTLTIHLTPLGDANLDGVLDEDDFALLDKGFATDGQYWWQGDFNYDAKVDQLDYLALDRTYLSFQAQGSQSLGPLLSLRTSQFGPTYASQLLTSIPEPTLPACVFAGLPLLRKRWSKRARKVRVNRAQTTVERRFCVAFDPGK